MHHRKLFDPSVRMQNEKKEARQKTNMKIANINKSGAEGKAVADRKIKFRWLAARPSGIDCSLKNSFYVITSRHAYGTTCVSPLLVSGGRALYDKKRTCSIIHMYGGGQGAYPVIWNFHLYRGRRRKGKRAFAQWRRCAFRLAEMRVTRAAPRRRGNFALLICALSRVSCAGAKIAWRFRSKDFKCFPWQIS